MVFGRKKKEPFKKVESEVEVVEDSPMKELAKESVSKEEKEVFEVVKELPTQQIRKAKAEDGTVITYITIEEALTQFVNEED